MQSATTYSMVPEDLNDNTYSETTTEVYLEDCANTGSKSLCEWVSEYEKGEDYFREQYYQVKSCHSYQFEQYLGESLITLKALFTDSNRVIFSY